MNIELRQLRYFIAVAEELHFGRAATRLHMTQPPLSQTIMALEAGLGTALFVRTKRNVALTPAGTALLQQVRHILLQAEALPELARRAACGASGRLTLAFVSTADYNVLPTFLRDFHSRYPQVQIELREATSDVQLEELLQGQVDAGLLILPLPDKAKHELDYLSVLNEPLILAAPAGLPALNGKASIALTELPDMPLIIFPRHLAPVFHDAILAYFHDQGMAPRIGQEAIQMQTIIGLVSAGMGIALVPQSVSNLKRPGVVYKPLAAATPWIETGIAWRRDNTSPVLHAFLDSLRKNR